MTSFQNYRASTFTGDLAELLTQLNIGGVAAGFSGLCNSNRSQSMCISGLYENTVGTYPNYSFNVYLTCHEKGHLYGSRHTHACVWNGNNTAIDGCAGYVEGSCTLPGYPSGGGTIMSYCWNPHWIDFTLGFGPQPGAVIRNSVNNGVCLTACNECVAPSVTIGATPNPICVGKTLSLSSSGGVSYSWSGPAGWTSNVQNPSISNIQSSAGGIYAVTVTASDGCTNTATVSVTVNPLPIATATATPNPVCVGATLSLSSSGGSTYSWSGPNGFSSSLQNPSRTNIQQIDGGIYTVTVTSAAGCTSTATVNVTVSSLSQLGASVTPNPVCQGELATFSATGGITFKWSGPNNFFSDNREFGLHMEPNMAGVYTVTVTNSAGCTGTATVSIAVNPAPNATISVSPSPACSGQTVQFTATGGATYKWSGPFGFSSTISNPTINNVQQYHSGTYTVQVTNAAGCKKILSIDLKVGQSPAGTIRYENTSTCVGSNLQLFASGGSSYSWSGPGGWTSSLQNPIRTNNTLAYSGIYSVTITNSFGCSVVLSVVVTIRSLPVVNAWTSTPEVCEGGTAYLFSSGATSYAWDGPQGYHSTFQNPIIITIPSYMTGNYVLTGTNEYGCNANATVNIQVQTVNAQINASPNPVPKGGTLYLTASGGQYYQWTGPDGFHTNQQNPIIYNFSGIKQGVYTCIVSSSAGCEDTKMVLVNIRTSLIGGENELRWTQGIYSQVYPNPASASLILDTDYKGDMNYRIINVNGEIILKGLTSSGRSISIDRIIPGNYFIQWTYTNEEKEHSFISRFIKTN